MLKIERIKSKYYLDGYERLKKKDVKKILLDINDESINKHVKSYTDLRVAGYALSGIGVIFGVIVIEKTETASYFVLPPLLIQTNPEETKPYQIAFIVSLAGGIVLFAISKQHLKKAVKKYNKIVFTPTSNGVGLVYRF